MAAFVTGAAGFIDLAVTEALLTRREGVIGFAPLRPWEALSGYLQWLGPAFEMGDRHDRP
jgi:nucleoside-diphosphate-sugar epimerase